MTHSNAHRRILPCLMTVLAFLPLSGCTSLLSRSSVPSLGEHLADAEQQPLDVQFGIARMIERRGGLAEARDRYQKILKTNPKHTASLHRQGVIALQLGQLDDALQLLHRAEQSADPNGELLGDLGFAYFLSGDFVQAESTLREALRIAPQDQRLINNLAIVVGHQGRSEECLDLFRQTTSEAESQANLAFVLSQTGNLESSKKHYHRAIERDPQLKPAALALSEFSINEQSDASQVASLKGRAQIADSPLNEHR